MTIGRTILGSIGGVAAAGAVIALSETAAHATLSADGVFGGAALGYGLGALAGSAVAARISGRRSAAAVPMILAGLAGMNLMTFPHPGWFAPAAVVALGSGWWLGSRAGARPHSDAQGGGRLSNVRQKS